MKSQNRIVIFNRAPLLSADGWIHIVPKGELPNKEAGIVQVLDDQSLDAILAGIEKDKNRLGDKWPGIYAGREHFIYDSDKDSAALAWFKQFEKRADGIWAKEDGLTPAGATAVANREYKYTSFVADPSDLGKVSGKKYRVNKIETVGFTNYANGKELLTPITNRTPENPTNLAGSRESVDSKHATQPVVKNKMKTVCTLLGLSADADEASVHAAAAKLLNRADILPADLIILKNRALTLESENQTLLGEQLTGLLAEHKIIDEKIVNRLKPILTPMKNREERLACLADFGFKPGGAPGISSASSSTPARVLNRGTGTTPAEESLAGADDKAVAQKIKNRASELHVNGRSFDSAWKQAMQEVMATK